MAEAACVACVKKKRYLFNLEVVVFKYKPASLWGQQNFLGFKEVGDINTNGGGDYTYIRPIWTDNRDKAASSIDLERSRQALDGMGRDYKSGCGGEYIYVNVKRDSEPKITEVDLVRKVPSKWNDTGDLNKNRKARSCYIIYRYEKHYKRKKYLKDLVVCAYKYQKNDSALLGGGGKFGDLNKTCRGAWTYVKAIWTDNRNEAATQIHIDIGSQRGNMGMDYAKGCSGDGYRYITVSRGNGLKITDVELCTRRKGEGWDHTKDLNEKRGKRYLYLAHKFEKYEPKPKLVIMKKDPTTSGKRNKRAAVIFCTKQREELKSVFEARYLETALEMAGYELMFYGSRSKREDLPISATKEHFDEISEKVMDHQEGLEGVFIFMISHGYTELLADEDSKSWIQAENGYVDLFQYMDKFLGTAFPVIFAINACRLPDKKEKGEHFRIDHWKEFGSNLFVSWGARKKESALNEKFVDIWRQHLADPLFATWSIVETARKVQTNFRCWGTSTFHNGLDSIYPCIGGVFTKTETEGEDETQS